MRRTPPDQFDDTVDEGEVRVRQVIADEQARTQRLPSADDLGASTPPAKLVRWWPSLRKYGIPVASAVLGCVSAVAVHAFAFAEHKGDAAATAREREAERTWLIKAVRDELIPDVAGLKADVRSLRETLRLYLPVGTLRLQDPTLHSLPAGEP